VAKHSPVQGGSPNPPNPGAAVRPHPAARAKADVLQADVDGKCGRQ